VRAGLDPGGLFTNAWTDRVLGPIAPPATAAALRGAGDARMTEDLGDG
jgi:hypothetical protein